MSNLSTAVTAANEIVKAVDFTYAHDQSINNISAAMEAVLASPKLDLVIGGSVKPYQAGGMNIIIEPIYVRCGSNGTSVVDTSPSSKPVSVEASEQSSDRIDIVQVRGIEEPYDFQDRRFRDPTTNIETIDNVATKKRIKLDVAVKKGEAGSVSAPLADSGFVKLAEIFVPAETMNIRSENIRNISARYAGAKNEHWTNQETRTFNPGYLSDIMGTFLVSHTEDGKIKDDTVFASMLKFGNGSPDVNGRRIPTGSAIEIRKTSYNALSSISEVLSAVALAVDQTYPYANNILSRYLLLNEIPVAASTNNVDITTGGALVIDGIVCSVGQMVFLKDQDDPRQNGFWTVQTGQWNRYGGYGSGNAGCFDNKFIQIKAGKTNAGKIFYLENDAYSVGINNLNFRESMFSSWGLPGKAVIRDANGRAKINDPVDPIDIANKKWVEELVEKKRDKEDWPIGSPYIQRLNDPAPVERGLPGDWETWSHRADAYGLSASVPARSDYVAGYNYHAGNR